MILVPPLDAPNQTGPQSEPPSWPGLILRDQPSPEDVARVRAIVQSTGFFNQDEIRIAGELVEETLAKGPVEGYRFLFADVHDSKTPSARADARQTVGYTCYGQIPCTTGSFDLYWIAVDASMRGRGLGTILQRKTEASIRAIGGRRLFAETSGRPQYEPTRRFYLGLGYREEACLADFYAPGDDKLVYGMSL